VDIIHTDALPFIPNIGLGMYQPIGHVDFYPNGGFDQPGCKQTMMEHVDSVSQSVILRIFCWNKCGTFFRLKVPCTTAYGCLWPAITSGVISSSRRVSRGSVLLCRLPASPMTISGRESVSSAMKMGICAWNSD
jgi:hypothetical protein